MEPTGPLNPVPGRWQELRSLLLLGMTVAVLLFVIGVSGAGFKPVSGTVHSPVSVGTPASSRVRFQFSSADEGFPHLRSARTNTIAGKADDISEDPGLSKSRETN